MVFEALVANEYLLFLLLVFLTIFIAQVAFLILRTVGRDLTKRTKSKLDDKLLEMAEKPAYVLIIANGFYLSLGTLSLLNPYIGYVRATAFVVSTIVIAFFASRALSFLLVRWLHVKQKYEKTPRVLIKIISVTVYAIAILMVLSFFEIEITPLIATLGIGGLAVGLALQNTLTNFFAGLHIISDRPIRVGDFIEIENGLSGYVEDVGWRSTRIRTLRDQYIVLPNGKLAESTITNHTLPHEETNFVVEVGVAYYSDLDKVERVTLKVAEQVQATVEGAVRGFEPMLRFHTFGDSNINFRVILRVDRYTKHYRVRSEFIKALKRAYDRAGIEISWPVRKVFQGKEPRKR